MDDGSFPTSLRPHHRRPLTAGLLASLFGFALASFPISPTPAQDAPSGPIAKRRPPAARKAAEPTPDPQPTRETNTPPTPDSQRQPPDQPPRDSFLGDPSRFTRTGGWGGFGASIGQWGFAKSMLINLPPVQDELDLSPDQLLMLKNLGEEMRDRGRGFGPHPRGDGDEPGQGPGPGRNPERDAFMRPDVPVAQAAAMAFQMMGRVDELIRENEAGIERILTPRQRTRLNQIALQMEGVTALRRPDVAIALRLSPWQQEKIAQTIAQLRTRQVFYWIGQGRSLSRRFAPPADPKPDQPASETTPPSRTQTATTKPTPARDTESTPTTTKPPKRPVTSDTRLPSQETAAANSSPPPRKPTEVLDDDDPSPDDESRRNAERERRRTELRAEFGRLRSETDTMQDEVTQALLKILNDRQRRAFDRLLGPPFDPTHIDDGFRQIERDRRAARRPEPTPAKP